MLGLPDGVRACLFDLDGVLTKTAVVHAAAWKEMFDAFLQDWARDHGQPFVPFDAHDDYDQYVDGKTRADGVRSFLASRKITLPEGNDDDPPTALTVRGLGNRKNEIVQRRIAQNGVDAYEGSRKYLEAVQAAGLPHAVVSSSANTDAVLKAAGLGGFCTVRVDGNVIAAQHLLGKPAPDTYLEGARRLGVQPAEAAVYEDAIAGVQAGRAGKFAFVVGVDRVGQADALHAAGADMVVKDLAELLTS